MMFKIILGEIKEIIKKIVFGLKLLNNYLYDFNRYLSFSSLVNYRNDQKKLIASIIRNYHVIEKGLTMPDMKVGFGQPRIRHLINDCRLHLKSFGDSDSQLTHALKVLHEYFETHTLLNYVLELETERLFDNLKKEVSKKIDVSKQSVMSREYYFSKSGSDFKEFSGSRHSLRNYSSESIPMKDITEAISLAQNSPSACNRQACRVYLITQKGLINSILKLQGGNRGFGHLTDKLIVITSDVSVYCNFGERNQAYVDGGIHALNMLYSLHYNKIGACILNCSHDSKKDKEIRKLLSVPSSEVFIAMISCGVPPNEFKIALSKRFPIEKVLTTIG
ncbi:nitroreductase family protein [Jiulongibacter sp. NS-SX5]|uniref:nitroreductase family protein n=1 Tax=Jiulongibacter sp. NS-SX5 TaxID=3463854 RepID=UPI004058B185